MKKLFTLACLFCITVVQAQYFQHRYNLNYTAPKLRNERLNSGIVTRANYINLNPAYFYHVGIGTSYRNPNLPAPDSICDRLRFVQLGTLGLTQFGNLGHQYAQTQGKWYNAAGNSIAEVKDSRGTGGFVAVGAVTTNTLTGATNIPGKSDMLFTRLDSLGNVISARRIDFDSGKDMANCIRSSTVLFNNQPTWIVCGQSSFNGYTDCFVARVLVDGSIVWANRYNFDFGGGQFNSAFCIARQLCEDQNGNIYVVGTIQDNPSGGTGVDGLAFALNPAGFVIWANNYHAASDDEFQAVRFSVTGTVAIGGFTNYGAAGGATTHMLFTELNAANGNIISQNVLRAFNGATFYTSKCYDLVQAINNQNQYYLVGPVTTTTGVFQMMYRTTPAGIGINWYNYNRMVYNIGFGVDNTTNTTFTPPGISYFSSIADSINSAFSDSHIMRTDFAGRTCKICPLNPPSNLNISLEKFIRQYRYNPSGKPVKLIWASFKYDDRNICDDPVIICNAGMANAGSGISNHSSYIKTAETGTGIKVSAYPNPVKNIAVISLSNTAGVSSIILTDINGKQLWQTKTSQNKVTIDMSAFAPGTYMVSVTNDEQRGMIKLVKE